MRETPGRVGAGDLGDILFRVYSQRFQLRAACIASRRTKAFCQRVQGDELSLAARRRFLGHSHGTGKASKARDWQPLHKVKSQIPVALQARVA